jgi:hypothetical protein
MRPPTLRARFPHAAAKVRPVSNGVSERFRPVTDAVRVAGVSLTGTGSATAR